MQSRPAPASSRPASHPSPTGPALRANPFPEVTDLICRLPLPTLFYCQRLFTLETCCGYGYGPARKSHHLARIFKGRRERTGHRGKRGALRKQRPYLRASRFQGVRSLQRKENSSWGSRRRLLVRLRYRFTAARRRNATRHYHVAGFGNIKPIPFRHCEGAVTLSTYMGPAQFNSALAYALGPTDPCSTAVHMEPFSTSVFKALI